MCPPPSSKASAQPLTSHTRVSLCLQGVHTWGVGVEARGALGGCGGARKVCTWGRNACVDVENPRMHKACKAWGGLAWGLCGMPCKAHHKWCGKSEATHFSYPSHPQSPSHLHQLASCGVCVECMRFYGGRGATGRLKKKVRMSGEVCVCTLTRGGLHVMHSTLTLGHPIPPYVGFHTPMPLVFAW